jgi:glycosyltransferase involved in cell wall biosynthesis
MISVVIPTLNAERTLAHALAALVPAVVEGIVQEAILVDGGSNDETCAIAEAAGTHLIEAPRGRGSQLEAGAHHAKGDWLLFLHADTVLEPGWAEEAQSFIERVESDLGPLDVVASNAGVDSALVSTATPAFKSGSIDSQ